MSDDSTKQQNIDPLEYKKLLAECDDLREQVKELETQLEEPADIQVERFKDLAARAQADLQNAKERLERDANDSRRFATEQVCLKILPTFDNFERAVSHLPEDLQEHEWVSGILAIEKDLQKILEEYGLIKMDSIGEFSNPTHHEVLMTGPGEEGIITEVFEDGYLLHDKVVRPAKVKVGDGSSAEE